MLLKPYHKLAARYFLVGMTPPEVAQRLKYFTAKQVKQWRMDLDFKAYMARLENQFVHLLDKDIEHVRRSATMRLQEIIEIPYHSSRFNMGHFEWAINKVFQVTTLKDDNKSAVNTVILNQGRAAETPEEKAALKHLLRVTSAPERYTTTKQGEA